ncbi:UDP-glucuronate 5'-epimerase (plasmid) [Legionella adelaidensis]|uniref:UDP-glucuronate 5'-epimerase n=1 Tax=Legionella adelaidensis TaxID=45056 RepID=A0A0W0R4W0_9GAMM|nr:NAD-dependent epimerase/dehydratase family protein [Legionella adelaidensis]KTC66074.1 UDP-glucuronate 5'-epimerase [Legionella adelaidensis]VEH85708.1 UDP-glucuronate 5'-epimerase [Legionella adelaidensis]
MDVIERKNLLKEKYTWLITGVAGFIGSHLLEKLLSFNQKVIGLDNFSTGSRENLAAVFKNNPKSYQANFKLVEGDICSEADCKTSMEGENVDYVLHHAALASVPLSLDFPEKTHLVNVTGFLNILNNARKEGVKRVIYASSSAVYGDSISAKKETEVLFPKTPYAVSKYVNELYAKNFQECFHLETVGLRYFNVFGPRQNPNGPYAPVIPLWIEDILGNKPIYVNGDGSTIRDFCYIEDIIQANILAALSSYSEKAPVFNVGQGVGTSLNDLLDSLKKITKNESLHLIYRDFRKGDIKTSISDISKIKQVVGYCPNFSTYEGLLLYLKDMREKDLRKEIV